MFTQLFQFVCLFFCSFFLNIKFGDRWCIKNLSRHDLRAFYLRIAHKLLAQGRRKSFKSNFELLKNIKGRVNHFPFGYY